MPDQNGKPTEAEVMTGFNPVRDLAAEDAAVVEQADAEGAGDSSTENAGKPAEASTETPATPAEVEITLDGRRLKAPKEIADAFTREINRRDGTRGAELQTLRERLARLEGAASATSTKEPDPNTPPEPPVPNPDLQIENPAEYQKQVFDRIRWEQEQKLQAVARQYEEAETQREQEEARRAAWAAHCDAFYSKPENEVLRGNKDIVDLVLDANRERLANLSVEEGFTELGRLARERLSAITGAAPELKKRRAAKPPVLEGSTRTTAAVVPEREESKGPQSLTAALKERRRAAADAFAKGGSGRPAAPARG